MNHTRSIRPFALILLISIAGASASPHAQEQAGPPVLNLSEIVLDQYAVQNVDAEELFKLASELIGRDYFVSERGGTNGDSVSSLRLLGDTIVLYDDKQQVQRARELLARLDVPRPEASANWRAIEYKPRFVSPLTAYRAVEDFVELSLVEERGLLVLQDSAESIEAALALLKRIDVPEKQVLLTCQIVEVGGASQGPPLPKELVDNLQKLLPQSQFTQAGMAMLKTSVGAQEPVSLRIESAGCSYRLSFVPVAFDESSASLTIVSCSLVQEIPGDPRELFKTNTVLRGGEYTVLAATGATPRLLVVRVTPQG